MFELKETLHGSCGAASDLTAVTELFANRSLTACRQLCSDLQLDQLPMEVVCVLVRTFVEKAGDVSHASCVCFLQATLLSKVNEIFYSIEE